MAAILICDWCGTSFKRTDSRQRFCCDRCRRDWENDHRREERRKAREWEMQLKWTDPWQDGVFPGIPPDIFGLDGHPAGASMYRSYCDRCKYEQRKRRDKPIDLLCAMCRDGVRV